MIVWWNQIFFLPWSFDEILDVLRNCLTKFYEICHFFPRLFDEICNFYSAIVCWNLWCLAKFSVLYDFLMKFAIFFTIVWRNSRCFPQLFDEIRYFYAIVLRNSWCLLRLFGEICDSFMKFAFFTGLFDEIRYFLSDCQNLLFCDETCCFFVRFIIFFHGQLTKFMVLFCEQLAKLSDFSVPVSWKSWLIGKIHISFYI